MQSEGCNPFLIPLLRMQAIQNTLSLCLRQSLGCSSKTLSVHKIDVCCTEAAVTTLADIMFILFAMTVFFPETSHFKLHALMSVRREAYCWSIPVEVILGYQSKVPSNQLNFTPTCDSCDCGFPVHGLRLASAYLWQLEPSLSVRLSLCLTLRLCMSLSLSLSSYSSVSVL